MNPPEGPVLLMVYRNHRGEVSERMITPLESFIGTTEFYPTPQPLLRAWDHARQAERTFSLLMVERWIGDEPSAKPGATERGFQAGGERLRYPMLGDPRPSPGAKVSLLTEGLVCIPGPWTDDGSVIAWAPLPDRDKEREVEVFQRLAAIAGEIAALRELRAIGNAVEITRTIARVKREGMLPRSTEDFAAWIAGVYFDRMALARGVITVEVAP